MSFDIGFLFNSVPADLPSRIRQRWRQFHFPAQLRLPAGTDQTHWQVETPIADEHSAAPGLWIGDDALRIEISSSGHVHDDADVAELRRQFAHAGRISVPGSAGMNAFIVATTLAEVLDGVVWDPQAVVADVVDLTRFRASPEQLSLEERGYFMADVLAKVAERYWKNDSGQYQKTLAQFAHQDKPENWLAAMAAWLKPAERPATDGKLSINLTPLLKRRGIKSRRD